MFPTHHYIIMPTSLLLFTIRRNTYKCRQSFLFVSENERSVFPFEVFCGIQCGKKFHLPLRIIGTRHFSRSQWGKLQISTIYFIVAEKTVASHTPVHSVFRGIKVKEYFSTGRGRGHLFSIQGFQYPFKTLQLQSVFFRFASAEGK